MSITGADYEKVMALNAKGLTLGSAVQREHGLRIRPVNCENSADPGMPSVYLGVAFPQVSGPHGECGGQFPG
jgi:hypothetical protein